jgi:hypothetical protein
VIYFEAVDLPELWDFFTALPTTSSSTTWAGPTSPSRSTARVRAVRAVHARARERVVKVSCPERLSVTGPPAAERRRTTSCRSRARSSRPFPDRVLWGTDWPHPNLKDHMPDDGLLVDFIPHIATTPSCSTSCWSTTRCGCTGSLMASTTQTLSRHPRHHRLRRRAVAQGLPPQPVLHVADEGREPRARFKADERAYLDEWPMTEEQKQAVLAPRLQRACIALGGNIYFLAKIFATDGKSFQQMAAA